MEKYYPEINEYGTCLEFCQINKITGIGSIVCQHCDNYIAGSVEKGWIKCKKIEIENCVKSS